MKDFEAAFSDFIDCREYDQAENALFSIVRIAFAAGWRAAGGGPIPSQPVLKIWHKENIMEVRDIETDIKE